MTDSRIRLLLCSNGSGADGPALEYGVWLAQLFGAEVRLLGILEAASDKKALQSALEAAELSLRNGRVSFERIWEEGASEQIIPRYARLEGTVTVVGPLEQRGSLGRLRGNSFHRLMEVVPTPVLYVKERRLALGRILLCLGGLGYALGVERVALEFARRSKARVTLVHVVEPGNFDYPPATEAQQHWAELMETDTPQAAVLKKALAAATEVDPKTEVHLRHGYVVPEILAELQSSNYDMVAMGSSFSSSSLRHLFVPDITAEIARASQCVLLTARGTIEGAGQPS